MARHCGQRYSQRQPRDGLPTRVQGMIEVTLQNRQEDVYSAAHVFDRYAGDAGTAFERRGIVRKHAVHDSGLLRRGWGERVQDIPRKERLVGNPPCNLLLQPPERSAPLAVDSRHMYAEEAHERVRPIFHARRLPLGGPRHTLRDGEVG